MITSFGGAGTRARVRGATAIRLVVALYSRVSTARAAYVRGANGPKREDEADL
jgi:hypothetical protein